MSNVRTQIGKVIGKSLNGYHSRVKPKIDELKFKEQYQGRIIDCMVGEVDDNYIETPETDKKVVKLEHSKDGVVKIARIKGKTILVDEEGNETDTPGEGCRLVSVGEDEDKIIILSNNNKFVHYSYVQSTDMYGIGNIRVGQLKNNSTQRIILSTALNGSYHRNITVESGELFDFSILQQGEYVNFLYGNSDFTPNTISNFIIYNPNEVKYHKTEILLDEPLRSLPNGVCDEIVGNKVIRRTDKIVIDGTKRFNYSILEDNNIVRFWSSRDNLGIPKIKSGSVVKCNILQNVPYGTLELRRDEGIGVKQSSGSIDIGINLSKERNVFNNIDFEKWLSENNVIMIYELEEPIIEELPNGITLQGFDDTTMYIENEITPTVSYGYNALIPYKEELLNQKEEVETNTLDIEQNIIPYLMDMEFNLMLMEDE